MTQHKAAPKAVADLPQNPHKGELLKALFQFQSRFPGVEKTRVNTFTGSKYASLDDVMTAARPLLEELELVVSYVSVLQMVGDALIPILTCRIVHLPSNEVLESHLPLPDVSDGAQSIGSFMTYWRRYLFTGMTNICEAVDDDGTATMPQKQGMTRLTEKQHSEILDFVDATNTKIGTPEEEGTLLHHIHVSMNLTDIEQLSSRQASVILKMLKTKYARQRKEGAE